VVSRTEWASHKGFMLDAIQGRTMYEVDDRDRVVPLTDVPQSSVGAPIPIVLSDEFTTVVSYYVQETRRAPDGSDVRLVGPRSEDEMVALVRFGHCYATMFGPPNDEAFRGHPLADRGLRPYGSFVIEDSSWIRRLERMNSVHPYHKPERFWELKHYVLSFHDSTFECIAHGYSVEVHLGSTPGLLSRMDEMLDLKWDANHAGRPPQKG
jgi:hypothetical protein